MAEVSADYSSVLLKALLMLGGISVAYGIMGYIIASRTKRKLPGIAFLGRYGLYLFVFLFIEFLLFIFLPSFQNMMRITLATLVGYVLSVLHVSHSISGSTIALQNPSLAFNIDAACLGTMLLWVYAALVLAEPKVSEKQKIRGVLIGLAILLGFNFIRITLSIYLQWLTDIRVHDYFWYFNMMFVLLVWLGWLWTMGRRPTRLASASRS
jgi:exosortase/archaeosortase family protein